MTARIRKHCDQCPQRARSSQIRHEVQVEPNQVDATYTLTAKPYRNTRWPPRESETIGFWPRKDNATGPSAIRKECTSDYAAGWHRRSGRSADRSSRQEASLRVALAIARDRQCQRGVESRGTIKGTS